MFGGFDVEAHLEKEDTNDLPESSEDLLLIRVEKLEKSDWVSDYSFLQFGRA